MPNLFVLQVTDAGTRVRRLTSLEELSDCSLREIEYPTTAGGDYAPKIIIVENRGGADEVYRIGEMTYRTLKHDYPKCSNKDRKTESLIGAIEAELRS